MSMEQGRLVKKKNKELYNKVEIEEFSWLEFDASSHMLPDNARMNVVMANMHDSFEMKEKIKNAGDFTQQLGPKLKPLTPVDLQKDYEQSQKEMMIKRRRRLLDEEEAIAQELAELVLEEEDKKKDSRWSQGTEGNADENSGAQQEQTATAPAQTQPLQSEKMEVKQPQEKVGLTEKDVDEEEASPAHPISLSQMGHGLEEMRRHALEEVQRAGYDEGYQAGYNEGVKKGEGEGFKEGEKQGFEEGVTKGIEQAQKDSEEQAHRYFSLLNESLKEIERLRTEVLGTGQEIFVEITKAAAEKLLRSQIKYDDATLKKLFDDVISSYSGKDFIHVEMNPEDAARLRAADSEGLTKVTIKENSALEHGDFKIEVDSELMVSELKKGVDALVSKIGGEIFEEHGEEIDQGGDSGKKVS